jgi:hypothetical protein
MIGGAGRAALAGSEDRNGRCKNEAPSRFRDSAIGHRRSSRGSIFLAAIFMRSMRRGKRLRAELSLALAVCRPL